MGKHLLLIVSLACFACCGMGCTEYSPRPGQGEPSAFDPERENEDSQTSAAERPRGSNPSGSEHFDHFLRDYLDYFYFHMTECLPDPGGPLRYVSLALDQRASRASFNAWVWRLFLSDEDEFERLGNGEIYYNEEKGRACFAEARETCDLDIVPACRELLYGDAGEGDPCVTHGCQPGLFCSNDRDGAWCDPVCLPQKAPGEACFSRQECLPDPDHVVLCRDNVCTRMSREPRRVGEGEECGHIENNEKLACEEGLLCKGSGVCVRPRAIGEACVRGEDVCVRGGWCAEGVCRQTLVRDHVGGRCDGELEVCNLLNDLFCEAGSCVYIGGRTLGDACIGAEQGCHEGLYCSRAESDGSHVGRCVPLEPIGAECDWHTRCESGECSEDGYCVDEDIDETCF